MENRSSSSSGGSTDPPSTCIWEDELGVSQDIGQGEGGEQGDPLMPLLFSFFRHDNIMKIVDKRATCQPAHTKPPKWWCSTSAVEGVGPSHPLLPLASSRDDAKGPCTAARQDGHPPSKPCCPCTRLEGHCFSAGFCLGELPKNACVSSDHLPPTSQARTTSFARPKRPVFSARSFLPPSRRGESNSILPLAKCPWQHVTSHWGHHCCVDCQLGPVEQRKSLNNHFKPASILPPLRHQVQVADQDVGANPGSGATPTGQREGKAETTKPETTEEQDAKLRRVEPRQITRWEACKRDPDIGPL